MAYFRFAQRPIPHHHQSTVPLKNNVPLVLPVLQAPEISSLYNIFEEEKYEYSPPVVPDRYSTMTSQYLTTTLFSTPSQSEYYHPHRTIQFANQFNRHPQFQYPSHMFYHR